MAQGLATEWGAEPEQLKACSQIPIVRDKREDSGPLAEDLAPRQDRRGDREGERRGSNVLPRWRFYSALDCEAL